jgi:hypothetical protein
MYFFYGLKGIVDLMIFFNFKLPEDLDYISLCVAVMAECILFKFHFFGHHEGLILMVSQPVMENAINIITNIAPQCQVKAVAVFIKLR